MTTFAAMKLIEVSDKITQKQFLELAGIIYKEDSSWVRPLDDEINSIFNPEKNVFLKNGEVKRWILKKENNELSGRIAAFVNYEKSGGTQLAGGIGFFECIDNQNAAFMLFDQAREWLKERNVELIDGPVNFGENNNYWGLLVEGFTPPAYGMNYHKPYYKSFFDAYGFEPLYEQYTNHLDITRPLPERFSKIVNRVFSKENYRFESIKLQQLDKYIDDFITIYNKAWAFHENFQPIKREYVQRTFEEMRPVIVEEFIWFAYVNDQPAGFLVAIPDVNQILKKCNGKMDWKAKLRFAWYQWSKKINRIRIIIMGIVPEHQKHGLESGLIVKAFEQGKKFKQYKEAELSWVGSFNPLMMSIHEATGAKFGKKHVTYRLRI